MQASYTNGKMIEEAHETFHAAFLSGEEHMEKGAESVCIFNRKLNPKRKARRRMARASRKRNRQ